MTNGQTFIDLLINCYLSTNKSNSSSVYWHVFALNSQNPKWHKPRNTDTRASSLCSSTKIKYRKFSNVSHWLLIIISKDVLADYIRRGFISIFGVGLLLEGIGGNFAFQYGLGLTINVSQSSL